MIEKIKSIIAKKPPKAQEKLPELLCTVLSCWLISVGVGLIADSHLAFQIGLVSVLWQTFLAVVISFLLTRRWWIAVIYFGILVPVFFLAISLTGDIYGFFESVLSFFKWWADSMPYGSRWYSDFGFYLVHLITNILIGILIFATARITKRAWCVVLVAFLFVAENYVKGFTGYSLLAIPFILVGAFPLIAGQKFQKIKPNTENHFGVLGKKWLFTSVSMLSALVVLAASFSVATTLDSSMRTRFSSNVVADFQTATNTFTKEQQKHNITLFDLGLVTNSTYIGGALYDIEPEVIAKTNLKEPALIKFTSFDTFNGMNWTTDFKKGYRINGIWMDKQNTYLSTPLIDEDAFLSSIGDIAYITNIEITMARDSNFFFTAGQIFNFTEKNPTENPILFDELGRIVSYYGQKKGYSYSFDTFIYDTTDKVVKAQISTLLSNFEDKKDPFYSESNPLYKAYTKPLLEESKPLDKLYKKLKLDGKNPYDIAYKISKHFSRENGYQYTERPPAFSPDDNIIEKLLENKQGHCLYYSTTMVALARKAGVPARLAAGYRTIEAENSKKQVIDKSSPYAWVECYIPNLGWIAFDPTPTEKTVLKPIPGDSDSEEKLPNVEKNDDPVDDMEFSEDEPKIKKDYTKIIFTIVAIVLLLLLLALAVLNSVLSQKTYDLERVRKRFTSTKRQAEYYYQDLLRQFSCLGVKYKLSETITDLAVSAYHKARIVDKDLLASGIEIIEALHYANRKPANSDIEILSRLRKAFERAVKRKNNAFVYFIKRRLFLPVISLKVYKYN